MVEYKQENRFKLVSGFKPAGDQPQAIESLMKGLREDRRAQTLLGVTGSGKTFTMAHVIEQWQRPTLVMAHNKTLAAQLYGEFKELFPDNAVEYFISYYDYYQPEAYIPTSDTYIEKDSSRNDDIDKLRHSATRSLLERNDIIIVASVSCIYGIGSPDAYQRMMCFIEKDEMITRDQVLRKIVAIQYDRNEFDFHRGTFRVRGDVVEVFPAWEKDIAIRIEFFGDEIDRISEVDALTGRRVKDLEKVAIYPATHYVVEPAARMRAIEAIKAELRDRLEVLYKANKLVEAQRLEQRTLHDLEMLAEVGTCPGIENYSRHLTGREEGEAPPTLMDYFPKDFLLIVDESHQTVPQIGAMYKGDRSRKETLVEYGFRLPSALDNRPLKFAEWEGKIRNAVFVSATPADWELRQSGGEVVEQIIRPTGLVDPVVEVRPAGGQVDDLLGEIRRIVARKARVLVTTLTKRSAENLTEYYNEVGVKVRYLHSDVDSLERVEIIRQLRLGEFDVLVGINLLREGLDLPEVELVAILDADKEGFLRGETALIQTFGRAARNLDGHVIMYGDTITRSMERAMEETSRRRARQTAYNEEHGITPQSVRSEIKNLLANIYTADYVDVTGPLQVAEDQAEYISPKEIPARVNKLEAEMKKAAKDLDFERAAELRDEISRLREFELRVG
ncbi:MAG: excinuclease ABC subunit UvrB [Chrysiogenetes bacterium]|nr:excinuclease ABC subunit UvrB [Chrysiogenetes bacterium]